MISYNIAPFTDKVFEYMQDAVNNKKIGTSTNGIGQKPAAIIAGIVEPIILSALIFPLWMKSSIEEISEKNSKWLCK